MSKAIYGHLIVSNEQISDICRTIESLYPICDEILVVSDGTQPAIDEWLKNRVNIYNLKLFQNPFTTLKQQRQLLLDKTPVDNWVVALDADEAYSMATTKELRDCLLYKLSQKHYDTSKNDNVPLCVSVPVMNLVNDPIHYDGEGIYHAQKIFYYRGGLHWDYDQYFTHLTYKPGPLKFEEGADTTVYSITGPTSWVIKHFARLNPERLKWRATHIKDPKFGKYELRAWEKKPPKIVGLEKDKW